MSLETIFSEEGSWMGTIQAASHLQRSTSINQSPLLRLALR